MLGAPSFRVFAKGWDSTEPHPMVELSTPVQYVKGVGPRIGEVLAAKGIHTVGDLLHYLPFRYEDRLNPRGIAELRPGEMATVIGEVRNSGLFRTRRMPIFQLTVGQGRSRLRCLFFNATYLQDKFKPGETLICVFSRLLGSLLFCFHASAVEPFVSQFEKLFTVRLVLRNIGRAAESLSRQGFNVRRARAFPMTDAPHSN